MDKYIYDENNRLWYELQGDYYIPCLTLPTEKEHKPIGLWGQRHKRYLQEHNKIFYTTLLTSGKLNEYLPLFTFGLMSFNSVDFAKTADFQTLKEA